MMYLGSTSSRPDYRLMSSYTYLTRYTTLFESANEIVRPRKRMLIGCSEREGALLTAYLSRVCTLLIIESAFEQKSHFSSSYKSSRYPWSTMWLKTVSSATKMSFKSSKMVELPLDWLCVLIWTKKGRISLRCTNSNSSFAIGTFYPSAFSYCSIWIIGGALTCEGCFECSWSIEEEELESDFGLVPFPSALSASPSACSTSSSNMNLEPSPGWDENVRLPLRLLEISRQMLKPSPWLSAFICWLLALFDLWNGLKIVVWSLPEIPIP